MLHLQKLVFISSQRGYEDLGLHESMKFDLRFYGFNYTETVGSYEGTKEVSFMVAINSSHDLDLMIQLGKHYNQDSILYRDHEGNSNLIFMDGRESINLGKMVQVSEKEALSSIAYTYVPNLNSYWIAK